MPSAFSPNLNLLLQATGEDAGTWGQNLNNGVFTILDNALGNTLSLPLTNANVTLTTTQSQNNFIDLTGTLTGNVQIIFPQIGRTYFVRNSTTGAFTVTLKTSAVGGATYQLQQGQARFVTLNGTDVIVAFDGGNGAVINIASAATTDLGTIITQNANITGTTTITSFGSSAKTSSPLYQVTFAGALTLTYNATSLITPSAGNVYTQAGDTALLLYLGSGNWQILSYSANTFIPGVQLIAGGFRNLNITTTSNTGLTISADAATLEDASGRAYRARGVNLSAALTTSGANGLDTGTETASTWYSVWLIYNQTTNTLASLLSASATSPTLPAGYTFRARFGWIRNDASANLWRTVQYGRVAQIVIGTNPLVTPLIANGGNGSVNNNSPTLATISLAAFVPPTACKASLYLYAGYKSGAIGTIIIAPNAAFGGTNRGPNGSQGQIYPLIINNTGGYDSAGFAIGQKYDFVLEALSFGLACAGAAVVGIGGWEDNL